jgi:hypothetical protein
VPAEEAQDLLAQRLERLHEASGVPVLVRLLNEQDDPFPQPMRSVGEMVTALRKDQKWQCKWRDNTS